MVSYRLAVYGLGLIGVGVVLLLFDVFIGDMLAVSASVTSSQTAGTANDIFASIMDGFVFLLFMLGGVFLLAGALEDRARKVR